MQTIRVRAIVDEHHRLTAQVPPHVAPGQVEIAVLIPRSADEDDAGAAWADAIAREWADDLADPRQDVYTLPDGDSVNEAR